MTASPTTITTPPPPQQQQQGQGQLAVLSAESENRVDRSGVENGLVSGVENGLADRLENAVKSGGGRSEGVEGGVEGPGDADAVPLLRPAAELTTMREVRECIDTLDRAMVALLGQRMRYIEAAARIKTSRSAVHDQWRIDDVLAKVRANAAEEHVRFPPELAEQVYTVLIQGSIKHEFERWDEERGGRDGGEGV